MIRVKICGVTTPDEAAFAIDAGADAVGLNFYAKSPRYLTTDRAVQILRGLPPFAAAVGVFVDDTPEETLRLTHTLGLRAAQTYHIFPLDFRTFPAAHILAFRIRDNSDLTTVRETVNAGRTNGLTPAAVLLDSYVEGELGGTGHKVPWHLLAGFDPEVPVILAGGLTPDNVADAIQLVRPWGVDVASGVESAPGRKDPGKVRAFLQAVRAAEAELAR